MPIIIDVTIQGKLKHPIMSNVTSDNDKMDFGKGSAGMINIADKNVAKINQSKGIPAIPAQVKNMSNGGQQAQSIAKANTVTIGEATKGQSINTTA